MFKGFATFIMRGNVIDLAVAVIIGAAFNGVVTALVQDFLTPSITAIAGKPDFSALTFTINNSIFHYGHFFNALISFLAVASVVYFCVVTPMNALNKRISPKAVEELPTLRTCPACISEIPTTATRCSACTGTVTPIAL